MKECMDEGVLQSYFDGELSSEMMEQVAKHTAACTACDATLREIESESLMMTEAFAPELALAVPTERLRARLDAAVAELQTPEPGRAVLEQRGSRVRGWLAALAAPFSYVPQHAVGFASLIAVLIFGVVFAFIIMRPAATDLKLAANAGKPSVATAIEKGQSPVDETSGLDVTTTTGVTTPAVSRSNNNQVRIINAGATAKNATPATPDAAAASTTPNVQLLPGERDYLKTIASLETAISASDNSLRPGLRAEYERNLQVVDEAIAQTRAVAQRNPNDKDATDFLLTSYQSKVELMNTVAEQAQLASIR